MRRFKVTLKSRVLLIYYENQYKSLYALIQQYLVYSNITSTIGHTSFITCGIKEQNETVEKTIDKGYDIW